MFGEWITEEILYPLPHRQYVFTIPKMLRPHFRFDRELLGGRCPALPASQDRVAERCWPVVGLGCAFLTISHILSRPAMALMPA